MTGVKAMNCPNCGAGVAADSSRCEFCKTRLRTRACPHCFSMMFVGARHCERCGKKVTDIAEQEKSVGDCPRCRFRLEHLNVGHVSISECGKCGGLWMTAEAFEEVCSDREEQSSILEYKRSVQSSVSVEPIKYVPCPVCGQLMNRSNFAKASGVIIDTCRGHGVWFDANELPRIIQFIQNGGMSIARQRQLREIEEQRRQLKDEVRSSRLISRRFDPERSYDDEAGVKGFLRRLFE